MNAVLSASRSRCRAPEPLRTRMRTRTPPSARSVATVTGRTACSSVTAVMPGKRESPPPPPPLGLQKEAGGGGQAASWSAGLRLRPVRGTSCRASVRSDTSVPARDTSPCAPCPSARGSVTPSVPAGPTGFRHCHVHSPPVPLTSHATATKENRPGDRGRPGEAGQQAWGPGRGARGTRLPARPGPRGAAAGCSMPLGPPTPPVQAATGHRASSRPCHCHCRSCPCAICLVSGPLPGQSPQGFLARLKTFCYERVTGLRKAPRADWSGRGRPPPAGLARSRNVTAPSVAASLSSQPYWAAVLWTWSWPFRVPWSYVSAAVSLEGRGGAWCPAGQSARGSTDCGLMGTQGPGVAERSELCSRGRRVQLPGAAAELGTWGKGPGQRGAAVEGEAWRPPGWRHRPGLHSRPAPPAPPPPDRGASFLRFLAASGGPRAWLVPLARHSQSRFP